MAVHRLMTCAATLCCIGVFYTPVAAARDLVVDGYSPLCVGKSDGEDPPGYCTIQAAIEAAHAEGGGDVAVLPGIYRENIQLYEDVKIQGEGDDGEIIIEFPGGSLPEALVVTANHSGLSGVTLRIPEGAAAPLPLILIAGVEEVEIEDVVLDGGFNRGSIGVFVQNQLLETSRIRHAELRRLEVGILAEDANFRITRCLFEDLLRDGIHVRPPSDKGAAKGEEDYEAPELGDEDDLELSGFNRFRNIGGFRDELDQVINQGDAFFLRNTTGVPLTAQLNDWGIYETAGIAASLSDAEPGAKRALAKAAAIDATPPVVFEPYLGKSIFPGSVFVRVRDALSLASLTNAAPRLQLNFIDTKIDPAFDPVSKLYSFTFINPNTYSVLAQAPAYLPASRIAVVGAGQIVALEIPITPDGSVGEGEGEGAPSTHSSDRNGDGKIDLSELLRTIQFYNSLAYHCEPGTEDGYAINSGAQDCAPHAADYAPQDWKVSLSETLRNIQFYNSVGYYACPGSEDGFCPGLAN